MLIHVQDADRTHLTVTLRYEKARNRWSYYVLPFGADPNSTTLAPTIFDKVTMGVAGEPLILERGGKKVYRSTIVSFDSCD